MNKLFVFFGLIFFFGTIFSSIADGSGGPSTTYLTVPVMVGDTTVWVMSTNGFDNSGQFTIDDEDFTYQGITSTSFLLPSPAQTNHTVLTYVYSPGTNVLNAALGFNVGTTIGSGGILAIPIWGYHLAATTLPHMITFHYGFLMSGDYQYIRYFFMACAVGFTVYVIYSVLWIFAWLASKFF